MVSAKITTTSSFTTADAQMMAPYVLPTDNWGRTHYGFYVLDLPPPWSYLNACVSIGAAGSHTMTRPIAEQKNRLDCRRDSSLHVSTGGSQEAAGGWHYAMYDTADSSQAELAEDGRVLKWAHRGGTANSMPAGTFEIYQSFPDYFIRGRWADWELDLTIKATQVPATVTHFARLKGRYEHFSLMATASGRIKFQDGATIEASTLKWPANIEYARAVTPQMISPIRLPLNKMLPDTMFTYQVLTVSSPASSATSDNMQILIARTGTRKKANVSFLWLRSLKSPHLNATYPVAMRVLRYQEVTTKDGDTNTAVVPAEIEWTVRQTSAGTSNEVFIRLNIFLAYGTNGGLWRGKFGNGFNTGCEWIATYHGVEVFGDDPPQLRNNGHVEWIDTESSAQDLKQDWFRKESSRL